MRILTWNVNGWRKIKTYAPFHALSTWPRILAHLEADVICLQETKLTRKQAIEDRTMLLPEDGQWDSVWDFHPTRGYSGTAVYWKKDVTGHPGKAEVGVTGRKADLTTTTASSSSTTAQASSIGGYPSSLQDSLEDHPDDSTLFHRLDEEGRAVVLDFGLFVLFNLYCPVMGSESRADFRQAFYAAVDERARRLLQQGREVIIVGDINIARQPIDHCDASDPATHSVAREEYYLSNTARSWFNSFCQPLGPFHDVQRELFPDRMGMYTCWSQLINARPANYGTRIDYTLVSAGLRDWVKGADIQPHIPGSDHCPVYLDFHDERVIDGKIIRFKDLLSNAATSPVLATSRWEELNRRDLKSFFSGASIAKINGIRTTSSPDRANGSSASIYQPPPRPAGVTKTVSPPFPVKGQAPSSCEGSQTASQPLISSGCNLPSPSSAVPSSASPVKRHSMTAAGKRDSPSGTTSSRKSKQLKLGSFFVTPEAKVLPSPATGGQSELGSKEEAIESSSTPFPSKSTADPVQGSQEDGIQEEEEEEEEEEVNWAHLYSLPDPDDSRSMTTTKTKTKATSTSQSWSSLFCAPPAPHCQVHRESATSYTVNKRDAKNNFGRKFWLCSRPVGPGYEKKWADRKLEGEPGREFRCGFFLWNSDWEAEYRKRKVDQRDGEQGQGVLPTKKGRSG